MILEHFYSLASQLATYNPRYDYVLWRIQNIRKQRTIINNIFNK